jgi:threonine dehydratase
MLQVDRNHIERVAALIRPYIRLTPIVETSGSDFGLEPCRVTFKLELLQHASSFKTRGAFTNLLLRKVPDVGVVAASGGNHGAAVAYAAQRLGVRAKIYVPTVSSPAKITRIRRYGAELAIGGETYADALAASDAWAAESGALSIHAFDQVETLLGQGTLGMEFESQARDLDTILVAVGGGGLIGGILTWFERRVRVVGVEPFTAPTMTEALKAGQPVDAPVGGIAVDSLAPRRVGDLVFPVVQSHLDRVVLVTDDAIREAQRVLWDGLRIAAEPGGVTAFSALLSGAYQPAHDERIGVIISGGNTDAVHFGSPSREVHESFRP